MRGGWVVLRRFLRDRASLLGALIVLTLVLCAIFAPWIAPHPDDIYDFHTANRLKPPSWFNPFGTDRMGSDLLSRMLFGARTTLTICVIAVGIAWCIARSMRQPDASDWRRGGVPATSAR